MARLAKLATLLVISAGILILAVTNIGGIVANAHKIHIVAAENFWGNIAQQIGGNNVSVASIITNPNTDPHLYESDAHDAIEVSAAALVIENGLGYDDFMDKLVSASPSSHRVVITASDVMGVTGANANPHLWYDVSQVPLMAKSIESSLAAKDPKDAPVFARNLQTWSTHLNYARSYFAVHCSQQMSSKSSALA